MAPKKWIDEIIAAAMAVDEHPTVTFGSRKYTSPKHGEIYHGSTPVDVWESSNRGELFEDYASKFNPEYTNVPFDEALAGAYAGHLDFPYEPSSIGYIKDFDYRPAPTDLSRTWTDKQSLGMSPSRRSPANRREWVNSTVNAHINRGARKAVNFAEKQGWISTGSANDMRQQIRNANYEDFRTLPGKTGKSTMSFENPYRDAKIRQKQAYEATNFLPKESEAWQAARDEFLYQGSRAKHYNPYNPYTTKYRPAIKGALIALPLAYGMSKRMKPVKNNRTQNKKVTNKYF